MEKNVLCSEEEECPLDGRGGGQLSAMPNEALNPFACIVVTLLAAIKGRGVLWVFRAKPQFTGGRSLDNNKHIKCPLYRMA